MEGLGLVKEKKVRGTSNERVPSGFKVRPVTAITNNKKK